MPDIDSQALSEAQVGKISSQYVVNPTAGATNYRIPAGVTFPVAYEQERILVAPTERANLTLTIAANITTHEEQLLIPVGTQVVGELRPVAAGTQFVAQELVFPEGERVVLQATSAVISTTETIDNETDVQTLIQNTALGTAAAAAVSAVTGNRAASTGSLLANSGSTNLAAFIGRFLGEEQVELIVIAPDTDLDLTLEEDLVVAARASD